MRFEWEVATRPCRRSPGFTEWKRAADDVFVNGIPSREAISDDDGVTYRSRIVGRCQFFIQYLPTASERCDAFAPFKRKVA